MISMGLTDQQKLYDLPSYVLIFKNDNIVGLMSCDDFSFSKVFEVNGYTLKVVNFDELYDKGIKIQQELGLKEKNKHSWMTVQEYMQKLHSYKNKDNHKE